MALGRIEVITPVERRRWSSADKARLVAAMKEEGPVILLKGRFGSPNAVTASGRSPAYIP